MSLANSHNLQSLSIPNSIETTLEINHKDYNDFYLKKPFPSIWCSKLNLTSADLLVDVPPLIAHLELQRL